MTDKIRLGVVGLGHRGRDMFEMIGGTAGVTAVAACELNAKLWYEPQGGRPPLAERMPDVKFFEDFDTMLEQGNIDVLLVETPAQCHALFCAKALQAGIHVYSDIPSIATLEEADLLWNAQQKSPALLMTGATTMGWGFVLAMQDLCKQGLLGKPYALETEYIHDVRYLWEESPWRKPGPGNIQHPIYYCTHGLGPLLSLLPEDLRKVTAFSSGSHVTNISEADDLDIAIYHTASGVVVRQTNSFINNCKAGNHSFRVFGTEGCFEHLSERGDRAATTAFSSNKLYGAQKYTVLPISFQPYEQKISFGHGGADSYLWFSFEKAIREHAFHSPVDLRAGLRMTIPGIYAVKSLEQGGKSVDIHYPWDPDWDSVLKGDK